jgi:tetratricopeptide (TPR) repeat protein
MPKKKSLTSLINNRVETDQLLEKMKKNIINQLDQKLENNPHNLWAIIQKGWALNSEGKYDEAIKWAELRAEGIESDAGLVETYLKIIDDFLDNREYDTAQEWAESGCKNIESEQIKAQLDMINSGNIVDSDGNVIKKSYSDNGFLFEEDMMKKGI